MFKKLKNWLIKKLGGYKIICVNDDGSIVELFAADTCVLHEILEGMGV